jgi:chorismate mutase
MPIICDPSHIGGRRELIASISQQAMDLSFDGLIIESHICPDKAWSDASQQITPDILQFIINKLVIREGVQTTESLADLRLQIDNIDNDLLEMLSKRMRISREIGTFKKEHNMPVLQANRYDEIMQKRVILGESMGMSPEFVTKILEAIHEESVRQQIDVINSK